MIVHEPTPVKCTVALLTVQPGDFPAAMPAAIAEHLRMPIEKFGDVEVDVLRKKYPYNDWSRVSNRKSD